MIVKLIHHPESAFRFYLEDTLNRFDQHLKYGEFPDDAEGEEERLEIYEMLTVEQRQEIWGLSADLYSLLDKEQAPGGGVKLSPEEAAERLHAAFETSNWNELLQLLRLQDGLLSHSVLDYVRYRAWSELGHPEVALAFIQNAIRRDPNDFGYKRLLLELLKQMKQWDKLQNCANEFLANFPHDAEVLLTVGEAYHDLAVYRQDRSLDEKAVKYLREGFATADTSTLLGSQLRSSVVTLAFALLHLARWKDAVDLLGFWIEKQHEINKDNAELYAARGIVQLTVDYGAAIEDFRSAIGVNTKSVLPYVEYSIWLLHEGKSNQAVEIASKGLQFAYRPSDRAKLLHLSAIGYVSQKKVDQALSLMNEARRYDPTDQLLTANLQRLASMIHSPDSFHDALQLPTRETREVETLLRQLSA